MASNNQVASVSVSEWPTVIGKSIVGRNADDSPILDSDLLIHYGAQALPMPCIVDRVSNNLIFINSTLGADTQDFNNSAATDTDISVGWTSLLSARLDTALSNDLLRL